MERKARAKGGFTGWNRRVAAAVAAAALVSMMMLAGCPTEEDSTGGGGSEYDALIGKWVGSGTGIGGKYIEFTSGKKLEIRPSLADAAPTATYTVTSVSGGTVEIQSANATISDGSFDYTLNAAKTEMTVSGRSGPGNSVGYDTYTKQVEGAAPAGPTWTAVTDSKFGTSDINGIAYGGGKFVAVGESGKMATSTDGIAWTEITSTNSKFGSNNNTINGVAYGDGKWVAVGVYGKMARWNGSDPSWTEIQAGTSSNQSQFPSSSTYPINGIAYGGGTFVAVGSGGRMAYSTDGGEHWSPLTYGTGTGKSGFSSIESINGIAWSGSKFVAVGLYGTIAYSDNGVDWAAVPAGTGSGKSQFSGYINGIAWGGGKFIAVSALGNMATSDDGIEWTAVQVPAAPNSSSGTPQTYRFYGIAWGGNLFVAVGDFIDNSSFSHGVCLLSSPDGETWTDGSPTDASTVLGSCAKGIAYGSDKFVAVGSGGKMGYSN